MPLYLYTCSKGHSFEELTSVAVGEKRLDKPCSVCGAKLRRNFSAPAVHMRGYLEGDARYNRGMKK
jgi:putative FmdB family regulatory protein